MPTVATHADALRVEIDSVEISHLVAVGTIPGVSVAAVAARNGPGVGRLKSDGDKLAWQSPGSSEFGEPVTCAVDGSYLLEDGEDRDKWVRVQVYVSHLHPGHAAGRVALADRYAAGVGHDDVTAEEAAAGDLATYTLSLKNAGTAWLSNLRAWLGSVPTAGGWRDMFALMLGWHSGGPAGRLEISDDGATWVRPGSEDAALVLPDLGPSATDTLHVRRTVDGGASAAPDVLAFLHFAFNGL